MYASILFVIAAAVILHTILVYPVLLAWFPWRRSPSVKKDTTFQPSVSAIVAVHNGEAHLRAKLETLLALDYPKHLCQIIVVSDGSTDATASIAAEYAGQGVVFIDAP